MHSGATRRIWTWLGVLTVVGCAAPLDVGETRGAQLPVDILEAGLYRWTLVTPAERVYGHVVVRGPEARPIGEHGYEADTETWYVGGSSRRGGSPSFELTLDLLRAPEDEELLEAVAEVRASEAEVGTMAMTPEWTPVSSLGAAPMLGLVGCSSTDGCETTVERVALSYGDTSGLPTVFAESASIFSVFHESAGGLELQEGDEAFFVEVSPGAAGYPDATWLSVGATP